MLYRVCQALQAAAGRLDQLPQAHPGPPSSQLLNS
jgi:hypothetical protein